MKTLSILFAVATIGFSANTMACNTPDTVFRCNTTNHKVIEVCDNNSGTATYTFGSAGKPDKTITKAYKDLNAQGGRADSMDFKSGDFTYTVTWNFEAKAKGDGSVKVDKGGKTLANIDCASGYVLKGDHFWNNVNN